MLNDPAKAIQTRVRLEDRIRELGGEIPQPWPWDIDGEFRNAQLIEVIENLEEQRGMK